MAKKAENRSTKVQGYRYQSPNVPLSAIRRYAKQIASAFDPEKIILFGRRRSLAQGRVSLNDLICFHCQQVSREVSQSALARNWHCSAAHA